MPSCSQPVHVPQIIAWLHYIMFATLGVSKITHIFIQYIYVATVLRQMTWWAYIEYIIIIYVYIYIAVPLHVWPYLQIDVDGNELFYN